MTRGHAAALPPMISRVMTDCGLSAREMDAFAVSVGPGSFTGLRVAMAAAKGLAVTANRPLVGVSCFDAVALRAKRETGGSAFDALLLTLASKREEVFVRALDGAGREIIASQVLTPIEIDRRMGAVLGHDALLYVAGDATETVAEILRAPDARCRARVVIGPTRPPAAADIVLLAHELSRWDMKGMESYTPGLAPLYLRAPDAKPAS